MKRVFLALTASMMLAACGGSSEGKFAKNCEATMANEGATADQASATCKCAYAKLEDELDASQLRLAAEVISINDPSELEKVSGDQETAAFVMERAQGAIKSCAL